MSKIKNKAMLYESMDSNGMLHVTLHDKIVKIEKIDAQIEIIGKLLHLLESDENYEMCAKFKELSDGLEAMYRREFEAFMR